MTITDEETAAIEKLIMKARHHANMRQVKSVTIGWTHVPKFCAGSPVAEVVEIRPVVTVEFCE